jgi:hypothetical protein
LSQWAGVPIVVDRRALEDKAAELVPATQGQKSQAREPRRPKAIKAAKEVSHVKPAKAVKSVDLGDVLDLPVTASARDVTLETALYLVLRPLRLTWTFDCECLVVTTEDDEWFYPLTVRCYDVSDFAVNVDDRGEGVPDYDVIIRTITLPVVKSSWEGEGGRGSIRPFDGGGIHAIVVSQTWQMQRAVESLLADLRRLRQRAPTKEDIERLPRLPKPPVKSGAPIGAGSGPF